MAIRAAGMAMAINQAAVEQMAEAAALRVLVQTVSMLVFEQSGLSPDRIRAIGRDLAAGMGDVLIPGASDTDVQAIRDANEAAVKALFGSVADAMRNGVEAEG